MLSATARAPRTSSDFDRRMQLAVQFMSRCEEARDWIAAVLRREPTTAENAERVAAETSDVMVVLRDGMILSQLANALGDAEADTAPGDDAEGRLRPLLVVPGAGAARGLDFCRDLLDMGDDGRGGNPCRVLHTIACLAQACMNKGIVAADCAWPDKPASHRVHSGGSWLTPRTDLPPSTETSTPCS